MNSQKMQGKVKFFNEDKGFGFITPDNGSPDVFIHISELERSGMGALKEGQIVDFELGQNKKTGKTQAVRVRLIR